MSDNLPAKAFEDIIHGPADKLTEPEKHLREMYNAGLAMQKESDDAWHEDYGKVGVDVINGTPIFVFPNGDTAKELDIVILFASVSRNYYGDKNNGDDGPLYCYSFGGKVGNPTAEGMEAISFLRGQENPCIPCPANTWGSASEGDGKACGESRRLIVHHSSHEKPLRFNVSKTNIRAFDKYRDTCDNNGIFLPSLTTKITATAEKRGKMEWALLRFDRGEYLSLNQQSPSMSLALSLEQEYKEGQKQLAFKSNVPENDDKPEHGPEPAARAEEPDPPPHTDEDLPF